MRGVHIHRERPGRPRLPVSQRYPRLERLGAGNIAEGFGRFRPLQFAHFLGIAKASSAETQNHLIDARKRRYIDGALFSRLQNPAKAAERATTNLLRSKLRQADEERNRRRAINRRKERSNRCPDDETSSPAPDHGAQARGAGQNSARSNRTLQRQNQSTVDETAAPCNDRTKHRRRSRR
jgi:23S rRNA-intervening sequence protein